LWELVPTSFILDWAANIGDTISALTPKIGVNELASWVVLRREAIAHNDVGNFRIPNGTYTGYTAKSFAIGSCSYGKREVFTERYINPALRTWPQVDVHLNAYKLLDLGIVMRQLAGHFR